MESVNRSTPVPALTSRLAGFARVHKPVAVNTISKNLASRAAIAETTNSLWFVLVVTKEYKRVLQDTTAPL